MELPAPAALLTAEPASRVAKPEKNQGQMPLFKD